MPREFSHSGMLQRVGIYVQQQDFCNRSATWPNVAMLRPVVADRGRSCAEQCKQSGNGLLWVGILVLRTVGFVLEGRTCRWLAFVFHMHSFVVALAGLVCEAAHFSAVHRAFSDLHSGSVPLVIFLPLALGELMFRCHVRRGFLYNLTPGSVV